MDYRRAWVPGGRYFFTVVTHERQPILTLPDNIQRLREAFEHVRNKRPFHLEAVVVMPDHLHCIWHLPDGDSDFATRWRLIKHFFSRGCVKIGANNTASRTAKMESGVWQRRYWEHLIRNEEDWRRHIDYIHFNPVKHGYVQAPKDWPHGSFVRSVEKGWYTPDWGTQEPVGIAAMSLE